MPDRVDPGDVEQVVDQAAGPRPAGGDPDPALPDEPDHLGDGEEVAGEAQVGDGLQLVGQPGIGLPPVVGPGIAPRERVEALLTQQGVGLRSRLTGRHRPVDEDVELGHEHLADPQVGLGIEDAVLGQPHGVGQQAAGIPLPRRPGDLVGDQPHLAGVLDEPLAVVGLDVPRGQRHQPPCGVEDVGHPGIGRLEVAHRVGEDDGQLLPPRPAEHRGRRGGRVPMPAGGAVRGDRDAQSRAEDRPPRPGRGGGPVRPLRGDEPADLGVGGEQRHHALMVLAQRRPGQPGRTALGVPAHVRGGHQPAQGRPAGRAGREQEHPRPGLVDPRAAVRRGPPGRCCGEHGGRRLLHREVHSEHRADAGLPAGQGPAHRAVEAVAVGEPHDRLAELGGPLGQGLRRGGAVLQGEPGGDMQVAEGHCPTYPTCSRASAIDG